MDNSDFNHKLDARTRFEREFSQYLSNLWGAVRTDARGSVYAVYIRAKTGGTWIAVAKRYSPATAEPEVTFGSGSNFMSALKELNRSIQGGKWKPDRPYEDR